jgi:2-amino-4-hydroxy-6-hydroxymethyldihydropteridine diphosphokinase
MANIYLGLGSNELPKKNLAIALKQLEIRFGYLSKSTVYRGAAVGFDGDDFLNLVVAIQSDKSPIEICQEIECIHNLIGRIRDNCKWGPRPIDIDLLLYDDLIIDERPVRVPREDILKYSFVLRPIAEIAPNLIHPLTGNTLLEHWVSFDQKKHLLESVNINF